MNSSVNKVKVYGEQSILDNLNYIEAGIDIDGLSTDKSFSVSLTKPAGVRFMTETTTTIDVALQSETSKEFNNIQVEAINLSNNYTVGAASVDDRVITVIAKGVQSVLDNLELTSIKAQVDLSGYGPGSHEGPIIVSIDDVRVNLVPKVTTIKVKVVEKG